MPDELDALTIKQIFDKFPDCLATREKQVIEMRLGLGDGPKRTLQQIGEKMGITRERVRQLEKRAIRKLSHPSRQGYVGKF